MAVAAVAAVEAVAALRSPPEARLACDGEAEEDATGVVASAESGSTSSSSRSTAARADPSLRSSCFQCDAMRARAAGSWRAESSSAADQAKKHDAEALEGRAEAAAALAGTSERIVARRGAE